MPEPQQPPPPRPVPSPRTPTALWVLVGAYGVALVGSYVLYVRTGVGQRLDDAGFHVRDGVRPDLLDGAESLLGGFELTLLAVALAAIAGFAFWRGRTLLAIGVVAMVVGSNLTTQVLKQFVLERPHLVLDAYRLPNSFPSGHVTAITSLGVALLLVAPRRARPAFGFLAVVAGTATGFATLAVGWHRPSDVMGSWLVVGMWTALVAAVMVVRHGAPGLKSPGKASVVAETAVWVLATAALMAYVISSVAWIGLHWADGADPAVAATRQGLAFVAAVGGMFGVPLAVVGSIVSASRRDSLAPEWLGRD